MCTLSGTNNSDLRVLMVVIQCFCLLFKTNSDLPIYLTGGVVLDVSRQSKKHINTPKKAPPCTRYNSPPFSNSESVTHYIPKKPHTMEKNKIQSKTTR